MSTNFDKIIDRTRTAAIKYNTAFGKDIPEDVLPMWVADMDFTVAPVVTEALQQVIDHGIFGYSAPDEPYFESVMGWYKSRFNYSIQRDWIVCTPGIVFALATAVQAFTQPGDGIMIQRPVYYPFTNVIEENNRQVVNNPLVFDGQRYTMDFDDMEEKMKSGAVRMMILCSPHNPVGRVWTRDELNQVAQLCTRYNVLMVTDEIHNDFIAEGHTHTIYPSLDEAVQQNCILCTAPSKTFNLAGLQVSNIIISNPTLRRRFKRAIASTGYGQPNIMGLRACQAAYNQGAPWLDELNRYLAANVAHFKLELETHLPELKLIQPEGTYLLWVDCRELGMSGGALNRFILEEARLWLDDGAIFGEEGIGFQRFNIACPCSTVDEALSRLRTAVAAHR